MEFSRENIDRLRQWFDAVQDVCPEYLQPEDFALAKLMYERLGMRVPGSVERALTKGAPT